MKSVYTKLIDMAVKEMAYEMAKRFEAALTAVNNTGKGAQIIVPRKPFQNLLKRVKETECKLNSNH